jgi:hypothetical protein
VISADCEGPASDGDASGDHALIRDDSGSGATGVAGVEWKWSPQQISGTLKRMYPTDPTQQVSRLVGG